MQGMSVQPSLNGVTNTYIRLTLCGAGFGTRGVSYTYLRNAMMENGSG